MFRPRRSRSMNIIVSESEISPQVHISQFFSIWESLGKSGEIWEKLGKSGKIWGNLGSIWDFVNFREKKCSVTVLLIKYLILIQEVILHP